MLEGEIAAGTMEREKTAPSVCMCERREASGRAASSSGGDFCKYCLDRPGTREKCLDECNINDDDDAR